MQHIMRLPGLVDELAAKSNHTGALLQSLLAALVRASDVSGDGQKMLLDIIQKVPMAQHAEDTVAQLLEASTAQATNNNAGLQDILR